MKTDIKEIRNLLDSIEETETQMFEDVEGYQEYKDIKFRLQNYFKARDITEVELLNDYGDTIVVKKISEMTFEELYHRRIAIELEKYKKEFKQQFSNAYLGTKREVEDEA